jgi:hypothetical protein
MAILLIDILLPLDKTAEIGKGFRKKKGLGRV